MKIDELETRIEQARADYEHNKYIVDRIVLGMAAVFFSIIVAFIQTTYFLISIPVGLFLLLIIYGKFIKPHTNLLLDHQNYIQGLYSIKISFNQGLDKLPNGKKKAYEKFINQYNISQGKTALGIKRLEVFLTEEAARSKIGKRHIPIKS